jgi:hypothetical protein
LLVLSGFAFVVGGVQLSAISWITLIASLVPLSQTLFSARA